MLTRDSSALQTEQMETPKASRNFGQTCRFPQAHAWNRRGPPVPSGIAPPGATPAVGCVAIIKGAARHVSCAPATLLRLAVALL